MWDLIKELRSPSPFFNCAAQLHKAKAQLAPWHGETWRKVEFGYDSLKNQWNANGLTIVIWILVI